MRQRARSYRLGACARYARWKRLAPDAGRGIYRLDQSRRPQGRDQRHDSRMNVLSGSFSTYCSMRYTLWFMLCHAWRRDGANGSRIMSSNRAHGRSNMGSEHFRPRMYGSLLVCSTGAIKVLTESGAEHCSLVIITSVGVTVRWLSNHDWRIYARVYMTAKS